MNAFPRKSSARSAVAITSALLVILLASGCGLLPKRKKTKPAETIAPRFVGTIAMVNEDERFVLIDTDYSAIFDTGTPLKSYTGDTESGSLRMSPERRRPFFAADIVAGSPKKDDRVWQSPRATPAPAPAAAIGPALIQ